MSDDAPDEPPTTGPVAGKYELVRMIGRGGMGAVWEGRHATLHTRVAIKFIDAEYAESPDAKKRFENEAKAAARIESKHAIRISDHGTTDDGKPYIVMELLEGEPLDRRIERMKRITLAETARILRQVARALARAHELGIVHRDLKPENIFLVRTPDDDDEIAKVLDFGIAKFKKVDGQVGGGVTSGSTKTGAVLGTPFYMSPEQARGLQDIDHRSDLWSLGVIAYKCVTGVLPFEGVSIGDLLVKICTSPAPVPSAVVPTLSPSFDAWFARALEKEPSKRFQSAAELADGLAYAAGLSLKRPMSSLPPSSHEPAVARSAPNPSPSPGNATSAPLTTSAHRSTASSRSVVVWGAGALVVGALGAFALLRFGPRSTPQPAAAIVATPAPPPAPVLPVAPSAAATVATPVADAAVEEAPLTTDAGVIDVGELPATTPHHHHPKPAAPAPTLTPSASTSTSTPTPTPTATPTPTPTSTPTSTSTSTPTQKPAPTKPSSPSNLDPGY